MYDAATMRISHLLILTILFAPIFGCGSVNKRHINQQKMTGVNAKDPMMTTRYLKARTPQR